MDSGRGRGRGRGRGSRELQRGVLVERRRLLLRTSDQEEFLVPESVCRLSSTINHLMEDGCADGPIPLPNVDGKTLAVVLEYCNKHASSEEGESSEAAAKKTAVEDLKEWDKGFIKVDLDTLHDLIMAANYLDIKGLLDLTCQTVADMIKGKTPEQIRKMLNIENDFTPQEEEEIHRENQWAFE